MINLDPNTPPVRVDNSAMEDIAACARKAGFKYRDRKVGEPSIHLVWGGALHTGLATHYLGGSDEEAQTEAMREAGVRGISSCPYNGTKNMETLEFVIEAYLKHHKEVKYGRLNPMVVDGEVLVERHFDYQIGAYAPYVFDSEGPEIPIHYCGPIDLVHEDPDGALWVVDHKSSSRRGSSVNYLQSSQMVGYVWGLGQRFPDREVKGVKINMIYTTRAGFSFETVDCRVEPWQVDEWKGNVLSSVTSYIEGTMPGFRWQSCQHKYGTCEFIDVCTTHPNKRLHMLAPYPKNEFNPMDGQHI